MSHDEETPRPPPMSDEAPPDPQPVIRPDDPTTLMDVLQTAAHREATLRHELVQVKKRSQWTVTISIIAVLAAAGMVVWNSVQQNRNGSASSGVVPGAAVDQAEKDKEQGYVHSMASATEDMLKKSEAAVRDVLERQRPKAGERDRRGWEWYYADTLLNPGEGRYIVSPRPLRAMALSPDEKTVAVAGDEGRISLWSTDTMTNVDGWEAKGGTVHALSWNPEGLLAAGLDDGSIVTWNTFPARQKERWKGHEGQTSVLQWHQRDPVLISGGADGKISVWNLEGKELHAYQRTGPVLAMDVQRDSNVVAAILGSPQRMIIGKPDQLNDAHEVPLFAEGEALAWQPSGGAMLVSKHKHAVHLWNPVTEKEVICLMKEKIPRATAFAWSPNSRVMAVGSLDGSLYLSNPWDPNDKCRKLNGHVNQVSGVAWLKHRDRLLSIGEDGTLRAWDDARRTPEMSIMYAPCPIAGAAWNPKEDLLAMVIGDDEVQVLDGTSRQVLWSHALPRSINLNTPFSKAALAWSPDGKLLAAGCAGRALTLWNTADGSPAGNLGNVIATEVQWMPDGKQMLVKTAGEWLTLAIDGTKQKIKTPPGAMSLVPFSEGRMACLFADGEELRWQPVGDKISKQPMPPMKMTGHVTCLASNPAHTMVAVGAESGGVAWFDMQTCTWIRPSLAHAGQVAAIAWNADGSRLASFGADGKCRIFHVGEAAQTWMVTYQTNPELAGAGWNSRGDKLMLACASQGQIVTFDAGRSMDREPGQKRSGPDPDQLLADALRTIERNPGDEAGWAAFKRLIKPAPSTAENADRPLLLATVALGEMGRFQSSATTLAADAKAAQEWQGQALPLPVQVLEHCVLGQWQKVVDLCQKGDQTPERAAWYRLVQAEALMHLGQEEEAGKNWLASWQSQRRAWVGSAEQEEPAPFKKSAGRPSLTPWDSISIHEDWTGGEQNNLSELPNPLKQPGFEFATGTFIQMAGKNLRVSMQHTFPRITDWISLGKPARRVAFLLSVVCYAPPGSPVEAIPSGTCVGSIFMRRENGTAARIPLIYGINVWDWWAPGATGVPPPSKGAVAWTGSNARAKRMQHNLALYRLDWDAGAGAVATDFSISSSMRKPAPMLLGVEVLR